MPNHDYSCPKCGTIELYKKMMDPHPRKCPTCKSQLTHLICAPAVKPAPDMFWENENGGRGRYISQLQQHVGEANDQNAFCRSQNEAIDKAKRLGMTVERVR